MNILVYLHGSIKQKEKFYELINVACGWKKILKECKIFIAIPKKTGKIIEKEFEAWNIDKLFFLENEDDNFPEKLFCELIKIVEREKIEIIFMGNLLFERELAPFISSKLDWEFIPNVIGFEMLKNKILWRRFLYGTRAVEERVTQIKNLVITFSPNIYKKDEREKKEKKVDFELLKIESPKEQSYEIVLSEKKIFPNILLKRQELS